MTEHTPRWTWTRVTDGGIPVMTLEGPRVICRYWETTLIEANRRSTWRTPA